MHTGLSEGEDQNCKGLINVTLEVAGLEEKIRNIVLVRMDD